MPIGIPILTLPENEVSEADVDVVHTKVNSEAKFPTGEVRVASIRLLIMIIRPESVKIISGDEALSSLVLKTVSNNSWSCCLSLACFRLV